MGDAPRVLYLCKFTEEGGANAIGARATESMDDDLYRKGGLNLWAGFLLESVIKHGYLAKGMAFGNTTL